MNKFKNIVIFILSVIILAQSALLIYFMRMPRVSGAVSSRPAVVQRRPLALPQAWFPKTKAAESAKVKAQEKTPVFIVPTSAVLVAPKPRVVQGRIALVLDDWGYNNKHVDFITDNNFPVTLSILPFRPYSSQIAKLAYDKGKDVIIHMPMEPLNKNNYGLEENTLLVTMNRDEILHICDAALSSVPYACGMSNHMGSKATEDLRLMKVVIRYLRDKKMIFFDSLVTPESVCRKVSSSLNVRYAARDVFIDNLSDPAAIKEQVLKLAQRAKRTGLAFGVGHDRPATIAVLKEMIPRLQDEGYVFVKLSEAASLPK